MKRIFILFLLSLVIVSFSFATKDSLVIGNVIAKPGDTILVPVYGRHLDNIGSMGLVIHFDRNALKYDKTININNGLIKNSTLTYYVAYSFKLGWFMNNYDLNGVSFGNSKLFDIKFILLGGNSTVCVYPDSSSVTDSKMEPTVIPVSWVCGEVSDKSIVGIPEIRTGESINTYPNPANGHFYLTGIKDNSKVSVFSVNGELIYEKQTKGLYKSNLDVNIPNSAKGIYFIRVTGNDDVYYKKIILE
jgi:hypothetical protein